MRLFVVVMRDGKVPQRRSRVRPGHPRDVVSLHRFDDAFGHPAALRTSAPRRDRLQVHFSESVTMSSSMYQEPLSDFVVEVIHTLTARGTRDICGR